MEIKICPSCKGEGRIKTPDSFSKEDSIHCERCNGHGRLYIRNYEMEFPIDQQKQYIDLDQKIINLIRESNKCQS